MKATSAAIAMLLWVVSIACAGNAALSVRDIDFRNFSYAPSCLSVRASVRVHNGAFYGHTRGGSDGYDFLDFSVEQVAYGALAGDRREYAVVVTRCNTGGSGAFTEALIYELRDGKPLLIATLPGGDRADGGIASGSIRHGLLHVGFYGTSGGMCCPEWVDTATYHLVDGRLVEVGRRVRNRLGGSNDR